MAHRMAQNQFVKHLGDPSHLSRLPSGFNQLRHQDTDVTIVVGSQKFPAHKAVLSCASDYFQRMFSSGFQESTMNEITVPGTEESFAQILDFAYTGYFNISVGTIVGILKMACYMVFDGALELCAEYLSGIKDELTIKDCFEIWSIASNHDSLSDVAQMYRIHLIMNFMKCVESQVFLENSSASLMVEILSSEEIETDGVTEEQILQGAVMWLKYDWEQRKVHTVDLLKKIRVGLIPVERLHQILGDELLGISECKELVDEVAKLSTSKDNTHSLNTSHPDLFATRNTITVRLDRIVDCHEYAEKDVKPSSIFEFKFSAEKACYKLTKIADIPNKGPYMPYMELPSPSTTGLRLFVGVTGHLYAVGGHDSEIYEPYSDTDIYPNSKWFSRNNFFRYDPEKNEWIVLPPMPKVLVYPAAFQLDEYIYVYDDTPFLRHLLRYDTITTTWDIGLVYSDLYGFAQNTFIFNGHVVTKGCVRAEGPNLQEPYSHCYAGVDLYKLTLYKPASNEWLEISVDRYVGRDTCFLTHEGICYMLDNCEYPDKEPQQIYKCVCDFDSDHPTIVIVERVEDDDLFKRISIAMKAVREEAKTLAFTFDKHKLGVEELAYCKCFPHMKNRFCAYMEKQKISWPGKE